MESSASTLALPQHPCVYTAIPSSIKGYPFWPCKRRSSQSTRLHCSKMFVPGGLQLTTLSLFFLFVLGCVFHSSNEVCCVVLYWDAGFGEASPEAKAASNLHNFFNYTAVKIVAAQLQVPPSFCSFQTYSLALLDFVCVLLAYIFLILITASNDYW